MTTAGRTDAALGISVTSTLAAEMRAGEHTSFEVTIAARDGLPPAARVGLARRWPSDWGLPQATDAAAANFFSVATPAGCGIGWTAGRVGSWHPFDHVLMLELPQGLGMGEKITLRLGDRSGGSPGLAVGTLVEEASPLVVRVQPRRNDGWTEVALLSTRVTGGVAERFVATAPSVVTAGTPFEVHVRAEDKWGNPATALRPDDRELPKGWSDGVIEVAATVDEPGVHRIGVDIAGLPGELRTNPIRCVAREDNSPRLLWGDIHAQSAIGCGARSIDAYFRHARDFAAADFASHQANCFLVSHAEWEETQAVTRDLNKDGRFVAILGVEWSGETPVGGDRNLFFPGDAAALRRCSHRHVEDKSDAATDLPHVRDLHAHYRGTDTLIQMHVGGRTSNLDFHEPGLEPLLEVHSTHATSEWFLFEALRRGYRCGVTGGSDGVDGRPASSHPGRMSVRNLRGGLTAVLAPRLDRSAVWSALKARRTYATTGARILLSFTHGGETFGGTCRCSGAPVFRAGVEGTAPIRTVDLFRGTELVHRHVAPPSDTTPSRWVRLAWKGATNPGNWERARMSWDGAATLTGGRIRAARGWAFDTPAEGIVASDASRVAWRSITAGNWDGIELEIEPTGLAPPLLHLTTAQLNGTLALPDLVDAPVEIAASAPDRLVRLERLPSAPPPISVSIRPTDTAAPAGTHAYWVRVTQDDGAMAWGTPIWVEVAR